MNGPDFLSFTFAIFITRWLLFSAAYPFLFVSLIQLPPPSISLSFLKSYTLSFAEISDEYPYSSLVFLTRGLPLYFATANHRPWYTLLTFNLLFVLFLSFSISTSLEISHRIFIASLFNFSSHFSWVVPLPLIFFWFFQLPLELLHYFFFSAFIYCWLERSMLPLGTNLFCLCNLLPTGWPCLASLFVC